MSPTKPTNTDALLCAMRDIGDAIIFDERFQYIAHFAKCTGLELDLGQTLMRELFTNGLVKRPNEFFSLTVESLVDSGLVNEIYAVKVMAAINARRKQSLQAIVAGLQVCGLDSLQARTVAILAVDMVGLSLLAREQSLTVYLRPFKAKRVTTWLANPENQEELKLLMSHITINGVLLSENVTRL